MRVWESLERYWKGSGGGREVLLIAYPLILGQMSFTLQTFVNRLFLTWYSREALAGAVTGLFVAISLIGLFSTTAEYLTTFVAQYMGAGRPERVGPVVWQGIYFSVLAGVCVAALSPLAGPLFRWAGHAPLVMAYEVAYTRIVMLGAFPVILMATLSTFFAGRGETRVVLFVTVMVTGLNVVLDYLWIFGHGGFPRGGVVGAALATVSAESVGALAFFALMVRKRHRVTHRTLSGWRPEGELLLRVLRLGIPAGIQFSVELFAFAIFLIIVGRIGTVPLAASSIAFNLNMLVFMPMLGLGVGVSSLVGRYLGAREPGSAERTTWSAFAMSFLYMSLCGALYLFAPSLLLAPFAAGADHVAFSETAPIVTVLLRFVAIYSIFDMMNVVFASGLKGAGDTRYPLMVTVILAFVAMLIPAYLACVVFKNGVYVAWTTASAYVIFLGLLMIYRFRAGAWKSLQIIEPHPKDLELNFSAPQA
jgi:MATE family multidrug resistance protein